MPVHGTCVHATCVNRYMYTIWVGPKFWAWGENIGVGRNFRVGVKIWGLKRILGWEKILGWGEKGVFCGRSCRKSQLHQTWSFIITYHLELNAGRIFGIGRTWISPLFWGARHQMSSQMGKLKKIGREVKVLASSSRWQMMMNDEVWCSWEK